jgi:hypothetical protein
MGIWKWLWGSKEETKPVETTPKIKKAKKAEKKPAKKPKKPRLPKVPISVEEIKVDGVVVKKAKKPRKAKKSDAPPEESATVEIKDVDEQS